ncbi:MAG: DNA methylase [Thermotogaceae bacterium]|nr:DNA methylase [Thermotogaceae bacterium]
MVKNTNSQDDFLPFDPETRNEQSEEDKAGYRRRLAEYLKDPEFRKIEGFPIGTDEAILALSDPPYYTACPNPFLPEILEQWQQERRQTRKELGLPDDENVPAGKRVYQREPFAADVSEGKNDPIYNAHSYHTKVPHKAIMRYILHYTDPGDIVFDGFCGTGMTGVAAQLCGDKKTVESLGYRVDGKGVVWEGDKAISRLGARKAVLNDLSPAATFIAYNYNTPIDVRAFEREAKRILAEVEEECGWMYETWHPNCDDPNRVKGRINYTVWSDVFRCPHCGQEMVFWDVAVDPDTVTISDTWQCPGCASLLAKTPKKDSGALRVERAFDTIYDRALQQTILQARQVPVLINYYIGRKRLEKIPDRDDLQSLTTIEAIDILNPFPTERMPEGKESRRNDEIGLTHVHHFYSKRNLIALTKILSSAQKLGKEQKLLLLDGLQTISTSLVSKLTRYKYKKSGNSMLSGTLYVASTTAEQNVFKVIVGKLDDIIKGKRQLTNSINLIQTNSSANTRVESGSTYYIFVDPPFGGNLMYSELNFISEAWLRVFTCNNTEAIINKEQKKALGEYQSLMEDCFIEFFRILKPGRWMTVEFHNSQNSVWNAIQEALQRAGFVIADVRTLDKQQATFKQVTTSAAVKNDLIISAYKPSDEFEREFSIEGGSAQGAWEFIRQHLEQLPMPDAQAGNIQIQSERTPYLLYDRMLAFHLVRGLTIPISSSEFYQGLSQHWLMRDGMAFTPSQAFAYDQLRLASDKVEQLSLFVTDEASAIQWLKAELNPTTGNGPQTYSDLQPKFLRQLHQERYEKLPELQVILRQSFLQDEEERWFVPDLDKQADLEALREQALLHEFNEYTRGSGKIKVFRAEAIKAGFSKAWAEHAYDRIVAVAERLPEQALQEDPKLKLYYDNALNRARKQPKQGQLL